jgi:hypothetical protein
MGMEVRVTGGRDLYTVSHALKQLGDKGLGKQMSKALQRAALPLRKDVRTSAEALLPHRGGYNLTMARSLRFRQAVRETRQSARVELKVWAVGPREQRDVRAVNAGRLRHPVHGKVRYIKWRRRPDGSRVRIPDPGQPRLNPWVQQRVRPGFVDRPVDKLAPEIRRQMDAVVDYIADQIGA